MVDNQTNLLSNSRYHEGCVEFSEETGQWDCGRCINRTLRKTKMKLIDSERGRTKKRELCPECGNSYTNLNQHIKKFHKGIKPGKPSECPVCKKVLANQGHLNVHIRGL